MTAPRMIAIEAACIAGHLGEWQIDTPTAPALERGLMVAAKRLVSFNDAVRSRSQGALFRTAVNEALAMAGQEAPADGDERRRAIITAFNMIDGGVDLAASLSHLVPVEPPSTMQAFRAPLMWQHWREGHDRPHTFSHMRS